MTQKLPHTARTPKPSFNPYALLFWLTIAVGAVIAVLNNPGWGIMIANAGVAVHLLRRLVLAVEAYTEAHTAYNLPPKPPTM